MDNYVFSHDDLELHFLRRRSSAEKGTVKLYDALMKNNDKGVGSYIIVTSQINGEEYNEVGRILQYDKDTNMHIVQFTSNVQRLYFYNWKIRDLLFVKKKILGIIKFYSNYMRDIFALIDNNYTWLKNPEKVEKNKQIVLQKLKTIGTIYKYKEDIGVKNNEDSQLAHSIYILVSIYDVIKEDFIIFNDPELENIEDSEKTVKRVYEADFYSKIIVAMQFVQKYCPHLKKDEKIMYLSENDPFFDTYFTTLTKGKSILLMKDYVDKNGNIKKDLEGKSLVKAFEKDNEKLGDFIDLKDDLDFEIWNPTKNNWNPTKKRKTVMN